MAKRKSKSGSKGIKKTTTKASEKKNKNKKNSVKKDNGDIKGIIYICLGVLLGVAIYTSLAGALSSFSRKVIYNFIGVGAYILPLYLVYFGFDSIVSKGSIQFTRRLFGITLVVIMTILICSTMNINTIYDGKGFSDTLRTMVINEGVHGGAVGFVISYPLSRFIGIIGSYILYVAFLTIGSILMFDITLYDVIVYFKAKVNVSKSKANKVDKNKQESPKNIEKTKKIGNTKVIEDDYLEINTKKEKEKEEYLNKLNNKIQILDFMKNSSLHEKENSSIDNEEEGGNIKSIPNIQISDEKELIENKIEEKDDIEIKSKEAMVTSMANEKKEEYVKQESIYIPPNLELLKINSKMKLKNEDKKELLESANKLEETLGNFGVEAKVIQVTKGPSVTRFELQPSPGVKVSKIVNLQDDIALGLAASGVRMEAPIPGKAAIGIEVPNKKQSPVFLREVLEAKEFQNSKKALAFALGKDIAGKCMVGDLSKMPHMLIAGATGSGKSVCINTLIVSLLYKYNPDEVKLLMIDPKVVELSVYNGIPHLLIPVVTDPKKAAGALNWAVNEMTKRYKFFADNGVRNIESYNNLYEKGIIEEKLPYVVIIVDELADLMMACPNDVEDYICRLAQMARAAGMHLIIATQRPSVDVITGVIKANIPSRISFAVSSGVDSRTILDQVGAEKLLGKGDMLYYPIGENKPLRVQGAFISEEEVENVVTFIKDTKGTVVYKEEIIEHINTEGENSESVKEEDRDELIEEAINVVIEYEQASTSFLQRKLRIGFNRASRIMDELETRGVISEKDGSKPRKVLINRRNIEEE